jgi:hypothetical protein
VDANVCARSVCVGLPDAERRDMEAVEKPPLKAAACAILVLRD